MFYYIVSILSKEHKFELFCIQRVLNWKCFAAVGLQFDICYVIKIKVGFKIAEMTRILNYIGSYSFALQNSYSENFRKSSGAHVQWSF